MVESTHKALKRALIKTLDEKKENWVHFLEEITFSLNIRPRGTTNFSAFELVHGSRKPRLPTEADNLALLYPDIIVAASDEDEDENETKELVEYMQNAQENDHEMAGECLTRSKVLMKKQYDKKVNPITFTNLKETDEVLIENVYQRKKGGKFQDKWLGPYPIAQVNPKTVKVYRNKSIQRVKKSKVKVWKKPAVTIHPNEITPTKFPRLSTEILDDLEDLLIEESDQHLPSIGAEETVFETMIHPRKFSREDILDQLNLMKTHIINSIKTTTPLSGLHRELHKRRDMSFRELFDWRTDRYPSTYTAERQDDQLETTYEMNNLLAQWYLESFGVEIPENQSTSEDREFAYRWSTESIDYSTKVLLPVVQQLLTTRVPTLTTTSVPVYLRHQVNRWKISASLGVVNMKELS